MITSAERMMLTISLKVANAGLSNLVDGLIKGEFVTITRQGKPIAALVSIEVAEIARKAMKRKRAGFVAYLRTFPGGDFERKPAHSRDIEL